MAIATAAEETHRAVEAVWRIESTRLIAGLARMTHDVGTAEELAQEALVAALEQWPESGVPVNPGAWLMAIAKRRAVDQLRRQERFERKTSELTRDLETRTATEVEPDGIGDDVLRSLCLACHPVLSADARVALTLRLLGGLTTAEIARALLAPEPAFAQRIVRAKKTLAKKQTFSAAPQETELTERLPSALEVLHLICNEGCSATSSDDRVRPELCAVALRLGRVLAQLTPEEPEVHGLVAHMEIQQSRTKALPEPFLRARAARSGPRPVGPTAHPARTGRARPR